MSKSLYRPPERVVPFVAEIPPPIPGESLLGFLSRASDFTTVTQLQSLLALGGCNRPVSTSIATTLTSEAEIGGIATLLKTTPEEIRSRTYKVGTFEHTFSDTIDFFGVQIRTQYRNIGRGRRRVSPRALLKSEHHRAIWEITAFSFDPETMETLLADCPVCANRLGWSRLHGISKCDHCKDDENYPNVDLRDFPQPIFEVADPEALRFVVGLIDPSDEAKRKSRALLKDPWSEFSNSDLFETVMALSCGLSARAGSHNAQGRPKTTEEFSKVTPEHLAMAGRAIIGGMEGFAALAEAYRKFRDDRPRFYGIRKEFGPLAYVPHDRHLKPAIRALVSTQLKGYLHLCALPGVCMLGRHALAPELKQAIEDKRKCKRLASDAAGFQTIQALGIRYKIRTEPLMRLSKSGQVQVARADQAKRSPVRMLSDEVGPLVALYRDSIIEKEAAGTLGIPGALLPALAKGGHLEQLSGPVLGMTASPIAFRRSSVERLRERLWKRVVSPPPADAVRLKRATALMGIRRPPWLKIILAILDGRLVAWAEPKKRRNILKHLFVADVASLAAAIGTGDDVAGDALPEWIDIGTVAEMLGVNESFVWRLAKLHPNLLPREGDGYTPFGSAAVEKLVLSHILVPEISRRTGIALHQVKAWLEGEGVGTDFELQTGRQLGFLREKVEPKIAAWLQGNAKEPPRTEPHSHETKMRVIAAVEGGASVSAAARREGVGQKVASKWVSRWRETGSVVATGKGGRKSKLEDHAAWIRSFVKKRHDISLSELVGALKDATGFKSSSTAMWQCLERHQIKLAGRRKPDREQKPGVLVAAE